MKTNGLLTAAAFALATLAGCSCEDKTNKRFSKLEVPGPDGTTERTTLDFGQVQVNVKSVRKISIRNGGNVTLTVDTATATDKFGVDTTLPLNIEPTAVGELLVSFTPTEPDQRVTGKLTITANDPSRPSAEVSLAGQGVTAVAKITPNPIDFGDVYRGESKKVMVTLSNAGTDELAVLGVAFNGSTPAGVTGDLNKLKITLGAGTTASTELTYAPTALETLTGAALQLTFDPAQGGVISVPIKGRSTQGLPKLCFQRDGTGLETCADLAAPSVQLPVGTFCDNALFNCNNDGGFTGKIYFRNEGNIPVSYSVQWDSLPYGSARCDGGSTGSDFTFSNAPLLSDGGRQTKFNDATVKLPLNATDLPPWETAPVTITYRATSKCRDDAADQARVLFTRQGEPAGTNRQPGSLFMTLSAASQLPRAVTSDWSCGTSSSPATVPCSAPFFGVNNGGDAPLKVTKVELWEEFIDDAGIDAGGPNGGYFQQCVAGSAGSPCEVFAWAPSDGGNPNQYVPHTVLGSTNPAVPTQKQLGTLTFGPAGKGCVDAGAACPNTPYRIYAVIQTDDPYSPKVISRISGFGN